METAPEVKHEALSPEQLVQLIRGGTAYAIYESSGAPHVAKRMNALGGARAISLFQGSRFEAYSAVSPYLACLDEELWAWTQRELWETKWGVLVFSRTPLAELAEHFRRFLTAHLLDGSVALFRFQDPRVLTSFIGTAEAFQSGFWNGIAAFGWSKDESVVAAKGPRGVPANRDTPKGGELALSEGLMNALAKKQEQDFVVRCGGYLKAIAIELPSDATGFIRSVISYAATVGICAELDVVRFVHLVLGWKEMQSVAVVREILTYKEISGTDKVDLLCELAAFCVPEAEASGSKRLDPEAKCKTIERFQAEHERDKQFLRAHPDGVLTMSRSDTRWRKDWMRIYKEEVAKRAKVTEVAVGSVRV
jgi:hypothetical protein